MRRARVIAVLLLVILGGIAIGVSSYNAGVNHGLTEAGRASEVVRVVGPGFGFFPFGLFLFPLFLFLIFGLARAAFWGRRWGGPRGQWDRGPHGGPARFEGKFEDWHRRQHEQGSGDHPGAGGEHANV